MVHDNTPYMRPGSVAYYLMGVPLVVVKQPTVLRTRPPGERRLTSGVHDTPK